MRSISQESNKSQGKLEFKIGWDLEKSLYISPQFLFTDTNLRPKLYLFHPF
jgi:hypothetical protein